METFFGIILCIIGAVICWQSTLIIQEKKDAWRKGLTDYYGNPINDKDSR